MVRLRPHIARITIQGGDSVYNQDTGEYEVVPESILEFPCRVSPNGSGQKVANQDGAVVEYGYMIHADKRTDFIPYGASVEVLEGALIKAKGKVIGVFSNSMSTRIWL